MNRRGLLGGLVAAAVAPAIISPGVLMPISVPRFMSFSGPTWVDLEPGTWGWLPPLTDGPRAYNGSFSGKPTLIVSDGRWIHIEQSSASVLPPEFGNASQVERAMRSWHASKAASQNMERTLCQTLQAAGLLA